MVGVIRAAIDCGTNSIRLLVAEQDQGSGQWRELCRGLTIVRLGEGVDRTGSFSAPALSRTFAACREYAEVLASYGSPELVFAATSASRDVSNRGQFVAGVRQILGVTPQVITGRREAELSFLGATDDLPAGCATPYLVFDIGGGSTEFVRGGPGGPGPAVSVDLGCVRMTERHPDPGRPGSVDPGGIGADITAALDLAARRVPLTGAGTVVGLSGTVTTVAALVLGLDSYDPALVHHARIPTAQVARWAADLAGMSQAERAALPAMHPGRVDVIVAGTLILEQVLARCGAGEVLVSEHDILDGLVWHGVGEPADLA